MKTAQNEFDLFTTKEARIFYSAKRKRKLKRRGELVWWSPYFDGWMWIPNKPSNTLLCGA
jgi:hypothetical protein